MTGGGAKTVGGMEIDVVSNHYVCTVKIASIFIVWIHAEAEPPQWARYFYVHALGAHRLPMRLGHGIFDVVMEGNLYAVRW